MSELKCCPFCGGKAEVGYANQHDELFVVGCDTPICYGNINHFTMVFVSKESAIDTWNTRKPMDNIVENIEKHLEEDSHNEYSSYYRGNYQMISVYDAIDTVKQEINNGLE